MSRNYSNKNLTHLELGNIEFYLNQKKGYSEIGRALGRTEATIPEFYSCFNKKMPFFSVIMGNYDIFYIVQSKYLNFSFEYMIFK